MAQRKRSDRLVETVEVPGHPFFVATQAHPEFKSRPNRPHPLFTGFIAAAVAGKKLPEAEPERAEPVAV